MDQDQKQNVNNFVATVDNIRMLKDGDCKITFHAPLSELDSIRDIMHMKSDGEALFMVAVAKINNQESY